MKTLQEVIKNYAHDYRDMKLNQEELAKMLWAFWREQEPHSKSEHLDYFCSSIDSYGFKNWFLGEIK